MNNLGNIWDVFKAANPFKSPSDNLQTLVDSSGGVENAYKDVIQAGQVTEAALAASATATLGPVGGGLFSSFLPRTNSLPVSSQPIQTAQASVPNGIKADGKTILMVLGGLGLLTVVGGIIEMSKSKKS